MAVKEIIKYEADSGEIYGMVIDPERAAASGTQPAGDVSSRMKVKISKTNREFGLRPRGVRLSRVVGTAPDQFRKYSFLPVVTQTAYDSPGFAIGSTITVDGTQWTVSTKLAEDY